MLPEKAYGNAKSMLCRVEERRRKAEVLWQQKYPHIPFEHCDPTTHIIPSDYVTGLSYNLEEAVSRQKLFYYQVSLPHYIDRKFLESSLTRYKKFLFLRKIYPNSFIVPCYDIDLLWHSHQLHPLSYKLDTMHILGEHFNHDDSVNDRSEGSRLPQYFSLSSSFSYLRAY
jgi:hypothetical protein